MQTQDARGILNSGTMIFLAAVAVSAGAVAVGSLYGSFSRQEQQMMAFCTDMKTGTAVDLARSKARDLGFSVMVKGARYGMPAYLSVSATKGVLPAASFCTVGHDGLRVTSVSYNPWYH